MNLISRVSKVIKRLIFKKKMATPLREDGMINEDLVSVIYVVLGNDGQPMFIVALTTWGAETEAATPQLLTALNSFSKQVIQLSLENFVLQYHHSTALESIKKHVKYGG